jgi:hypothetical protein
MVTVPDWITDWIQKDRLVRNKFRISQSYLRHSKRIQLARSERDAESGLERFHYIVHSPRYGRYNVRYEGGRYQCNCPFFKHRGICSHIFGVCQLTDIWPEQQSIFNHD